MATLIKLKSFNQKVNPEILKAWRETINHNESIRKRLEESLEDNTKKHCKLK